MGRWWCGMRRALAQANNSSSFSSPSSHSRASYHTIQAIPRENTGRRLASRERAQGRIPTVLFTRDQKGEEESSFSISRKQLLTTERKQISSLLKTIQFPSFCATSFQLQICAGAGSSHLLESGTVLLIRLHTDPDTNQILNLVLAWVQPSTSVDVRVRIVYKGEKLSPGISKGGHLNGTKVLKFKGPVEHIPSKIEVDVSNLDIGDRLFLRDIGVHPSLKLLTKNEHLAICKVSATKSKVLKPKDEESELSVV